MTTEYDDLTTVGEFLARRDTTALNPDHPAASRPETRPAAGPPRL